MSRRVNIFLIQAESFPGVGRTILDFSPVVAIEYSTPAQRRQQPESIEPLL
jgi:hypothetical protein